VGIKLISVFCKNARGVLLLLDYFILFSGFIQICIFVNAVCNSKKIYFNTFSKKKEKAVLLTCLFMPMLISKFFKIKIDINND
jgi:hypothetical protein